MGARLWRVHYDAGTLEVAGGDRVATLSIVDWPEPHRVHCMAVSAWMKRSAELSGAEDVVLEEKSCRARGEKGCDFGLTWK
jgi:hypothetical protein